MRREIQEALDLGKANRWDEADRAYGSALAHAGIVRELDGRYAGRLDALLHERGLLSG